MQYAPTHLYDLFNDTACITIPKYQRKYEWDAENSHSLIRDIAEIATSSSSTSHWTGVLIMRVLPMGQGCELGKNVNHICREVIDGQQRLTTIRIWIKALLDHSEQIGQSLNYKLTPFHLQSPNDLEFERIDDGENVFLANNNISQVYSYFRFILWLGQDALLTPDAVAYPSKKRRKDETRLENWDRFLTSQSTENELPLKSALPDCNTLLEYTVRNFSFLLLTIGETDDAERIYAALNGNRKDLYPFDHLRNFVFSRLPSATRVDLYESFWNPAELIFEKMQLPKRKSVDQLKSKFLYDYLISVGEGQYGRFNEVRSFDTFKRFERSPRFSKITPSIETWVTKHLRDEVSIWKLQREDFLINELPSGKALNLSSKARKTIHRIRLLSDGPPGPLVMWIIRRSLLPENDVKRFTPADVEASLRKLEGYLAKTLLSRKTLTNMRASVIKQMGKLEDSCTTDTQSSAAQKLMEIMDSWLLDESKWRVLRHDLTNPNNPTSSIYSNLGSNQCLAILDCIEDEMSGGGTQGFLPNKWGFEEPPFWVEHIYPQKDKKWKPDFKEWRVDDNEMLTRLHCLGNLTVLTAELNKDVSNLKFSEKLSKVKNEPLAISAKLQSWTKNEVWDRGSIDDRTIKLVTKLIERWPD